MHLLNVLIVNTRFMFLCGTICVTLKILSICSQHTKCYAIYKIHFCNWKNCFIHYFTNNIRYVFEYCHTHSEYYIRCRNIHKCQILFQSFRRDVNILLFSIQVTETSCKRWSSMPGSPIGFLKISQALKKKKSKYKLIYFTN